MNIDTAKHPHTGAGIGRSPWSCLNYLILYVIVGTSKGGLRKSGFQKIQEHRNVQKAHTMGKK